MLCATLPLMESLSSIRRYPLRHELPELRAIRRPQVVPLILRTVAHGNLSFGFRTTVSGRVDRKVELLHNGRELRMSQQWGDRSDADRSGAAIKQNDRFPGTQVPGHIHDAVGIERMIVKRLGPLPGRLILVRAGYAIVRSCRRQACINSLIRRSERAAGPLL